MQKALKFFYFRALHLARLAGIEPTTPWFVAKYSIQLSYSRQGRDCMPFFATEKDKSPACRHKKSAQNYGLVCCFVTPVEILSIYQ